MKIAYIKSDELEIQKQKILSYIKDKKISIDNFIEDENIENLLLSLLGNEDTLYTTNIENLGNNILNILSAINKIHKKGASIVFINQNEMNTTQKNKEIFRTLERCERMIIRNRVRESLDKVRASGKKLGNGQDFLKSKYDEFEKEIVEFKNNVNLSFPKICKLLDKDGKKGFKAQSLRNWFIRRYKKNKENKVYEYTDIYKKHLLECNNKKKEEQ